MQINLNPTSERGTSRDAVNRPREILGDSHLISSDPRSRFGLVCDLLCCRGNGAQRQAQFQELIERFVAQGDSFHEHLAKVMSSFQPGLFAGGDEVDQIRDNLDFEALVSAPQGT